MNADKNKNGLEIIFTEDHYHAHSLESNGKIVKSFFKELTTNIYNSSFDYTKEYYTIMKGTKRVNNREKIPLVLVERNLYSIVASAICQQSKVHLSELRFNKKKYPSLLKNRSVDFWCMYKQKDTKHSKPVNFYIELKRCRYDLNKTKVEPSQVLLNFINDLNNQLKNIIDVSNKRTIYDDIYLGLVVVPALYNADKDQNNSNDTLHNILSGVMNNHGVDNYLISTWHLPTDDMFRLEKKQCRFVSILGFPISVPRE